MSSTQPFSVLAPVIPLEEWRRRRSTQFPSLGSLEWYVRMHKEELIKAGALLKVRGTWYMHTERGDQVVLEIAQREAKIA